MSTAPPPPPLRPPGRRRTAVRVLSCVAALALLSPAASPGRAEPAASSATPGTATPGTATRDRDARVRLQRVTQELTVTRTALRDLTDRHRQARTQLDSVRQALVDTAARQRAAEQALAASAAGLAQLESAEARMLALLDSRDQRLAAVVGSLQSLSLLPREVLLARPGAPDDAVRSALLLRAAIPNIELHALRLRRDLQDLAAARNALITQRQELTARTQAVERERQQLARLLEQRRQILDDSDEAVREASLRHARLRQESSDLSVLVSRLAPGAAAQPPAAPGAAAAQVRPPVKPGIGGSLGDPTAPVALVTAADPPPGSVAETSGDGASGPPPAASTGEPAAEPSEAGATTTTDGTQLASLDLGTMLALDPADGRLLMPVTGRLIQRFGDEDPVTGQAQGLRIAGPSLATVIAPRGGHIAYADSFRSYGNLVIIKHPDAYHTLLAGLGLISVRLNQTVVAGEPVGEMPASSSGTVELYFEYRRDKDPIDPLPHIARTDGEDPGR